MTKTITIALFFIAFTAFSSAANLNTMPLPSDFKTTIEVIDDYPLVQTGYSAQSVSDIVAFYQSKLGDPQLKRGDNNRMTLFYRLADKSVRISLFSNDYKTEIAIMITK